MAKKGETWSEKECLAILAAWGQEEIQRKLAGRHKNSDVYKKISEIMKEGGLNRDWIQCRTKIKHMKTEYKKYKDSLSRSGAGRGKEPIFFHIMDGFLGDRPEAQGLQNSVDTTEEINISVDLETELAQKYGDGSIVEKICPECNEKIPVKTAGVHIGENNCIAVYSDDDNLVCPFCRYTDQVNIHDEEDETSPSKIMESEKEKSAVTLGEDETPPRKKEKSMIRKGKPSKMQVAFENAMKEHHVYLRESDKNFLSEMKEQANNEAELRREEMEAYKDSMALLAGAIAGRQQSGRQQSGQQPPYYAIQHDISNQKTYYKL